jgi:hypothetical protein
MMIIHLKRTLNPSNTTIGRHPPPATPRCDVRHARRSAAQAFLALHWCLTFSDSVTQKHIRTCNFAEVHLTRQEMAFDGHSHNIHPKILEPINIYL